ncbi:MAG TPA: hypothetical protein VHW01_11355 [Polyangiaceae bacterium]|nr:hypothetical protein [Polyangiaceae bacterium]
MRSPPVLSGSISSLTLLATLLGGAPSAAAEASDSAREIDIESSTCTHPLVEGVERLTRVELNNAGLPSGADAPHVTLSCAEGAVLIRVAIGESAGTRQLDLEQIESALRARVIALAIAELVRDTAAGAPALPAPLLSSSPPPSSQREPTPVASAPTEPQNRLVVFAKLSNFGSSFQPLAGGGLGFSHDLGRLALGFGPSLSASNRNVSLGSVRALAADLSARLSLRFPSRLLSGELGVGYALGYARLTGTSNSALASARGLDGAWAAPFLFGVLEGPFASPAFLQLAAQLGYVLLPVRGFVAESNDLEIAGVWGGLSIGLGLEL